MPRPLTKRIHTHKYISIHTHWFALCAAIHLHTFFGLLRFYDTKFACMRFCLNHFPVSLVRQIAFHRTCQRFTLLCSLHPIPHCARLLRVLLASPGTMRIHRAQRYVPPVSTDNNQAICVSRIRECFRQK